MSINFIVLSLLITLVTTSCYKSKGCKDPQAITYCKDCNDEDPYACEYLTDVFFLLDSPMADTIFFNSPDSTYLLEINTVYNSIPVGKELLNYQKASYYPKNIDCYQVTNMKAPKYELRFGWEGQNKLVQIHWKLKYFKETTFYTAAEGSETVQTVPDTCYIIWLRTM